MPSAHKSLINLAIKLGYTKDDEGLCLGTTLRCLEAYQLGQQDKFIKRINKIMNEDSLDVKIGEVQEKVKQHEDLSPNDLELLEIRPFFDSLFLYHKPSDYKDIFKQNLNQSDTDPISLLAGSAYIQFKFGLSTLYSESNSFTSRELKKYLYELQQIISNDTLNAQSNLGMVLSDSNHAMGLFYQPKLHKWSFMDINQWPPMEITSPFLSPNKTNTLLNIFSKNPLDELTQKIEIGFSSTGSTTISISLISTALKKPKLEGLYTRWKSRCAI